VKSFPSNYLSGKELKALGHTINSKKTVRILEVRRDHDVGPEKASKVVFALGTSAGEPWRDWIPNKTAKDVLSAEFGDDMNDCVNMLIEIWAAEQTYMGKPATGIFVGVPKRPAAAYGPKPLPPIVNPPAQPPELITAEQLKVPPATPAKRGRPRKAGTGPVPAPAAAAAELDDGIPF
jgi:hypothetical protein